MEHEVVDLRYAGRFSRRCALAAVVLGSPMVAVEYGVLAAAVYAASAAAVFLVVAYFCFRRADKHEQAEK